MQSSTKPLYKSDEDLDGESRLPGWESRLPPLPTPPLPTSETWGKVLPFYVPHVPLL